MGKKDNFNMVYNRMMGKREICEVMLGHTAAKVGLSKWLWDIGKKFGFIYIKFFGYPPSTTSRLLARKVYRLLRKNEKGLLLDVGCSHGAFSFELARMGYAVVGIDVNKESVDVAQRIQESLGLKRIVFHHMDILSNPFQEKQFDVIIMFETLEHIKEDSKVIQEFNRILKDEGILIISVPYAENIEEYDKPVGACKSKDGMNVCVGEGGGHYRNGYNLERMESILENGGFAIVRGEYIYLPKFLSSSILLFPIEYPLSLIFACFSKNRIKSIVIAQKSLCQS
jgi:SAM-dependent methyltransferase